MIYSVTNFSLNHLQDKIAEGHSTVIFYYTKGKWESNKTLSGCLEVKQKC